MCSGFRQTAAVCCGAVLAGTARNPTILAGSSRRRGGAGGSPLVLVLLFAGCAERVGEPVVAGLDAEDRDLAAFLAELHESATRLPESAALRGRLALAYDANGFADAAMVTYAQAAALDPDEFLWPYQLAFLHAESGEPERALDSLARALAIDASYRPAWLQRGAWLLDVNRHEDAEAAYRQLLLDARDDETTVAATAGLARVLLRQERPKEAVTLLTPLIADSAHPYLRRLLGRAHRATGRPDLAGTVDATTDDATPLVWRDERRETKDEYIRGFHGLLSMAEALLKRGEAVTAASILERLREQRPADRTLLNNLSVAYRLTGREQLALAVLRDAVAAHPDYALLHFNIATLFDELGEAQEAIVYYDRALVLDPGLVEAYERKGLLLVQDGRYQDALATFEAMMPHGERASALYYKAMIEGAEGRWSTATATLRQLVTLEPTSTRGLVFLARSLAEAGRFDEARAALAEAEQLGTHPREVAAARARLVVVEAGER